MGVDRKNLNVKLHKKIKSKYCYCFYCGEYLKEEDRTVDHIEPISKGGLDTEENMAVACGSCNTNKDDYTLEEFIQLSLSGYFTPEAILKRQQEKIHSSVVNKLKDKVEFVEKEIDIRDISISIKLDAPKESSMKKRREQYLNMGDFTKTAIAEEFVLPNGRCIYRLRQGYINYLILKEFNAKTMKARVYSRNINN